VFLQSLVRQGLPFSQTVGRYSQKLEWFKFREQSVPIKGKAKVSPHYLFLHKFSPVRKSHRDREFDAQALDRNVKSKLSDGAITLGVWHYCACHRRRFLHNAFVSSAE